MTEIGNALREARNRQGLSIRDAEDATKIRSKYLQAMEQDDFEVIPGPTFVMGFLRTYALYLGLDADAMVDEYRCTHAPHILDAHRLPNTPLRSRPGKPVPGRSNYVVVAVIALLIIVVLALIGWGNRRGGEVPTDTSAGSSLTASVAGDSTADATSPATAGTEESTTTGGEAASGSESVSGSAPESGSSETSQESAGEAVLTVAVQAVENRCYLIVREDGADGKTLYSQTLEEGESTTFETDDALWMNIANPTAIVVTINGTEYRPSDPYGNFLATANGLERLSP